MNPPARDGDATPLGLDGNRVATKSLEHTTPIMFPEDETFDVGLDTGTGVSLVEYHYDCPFKFTGTIDKLTFELAPKQLGLDDKKKAAKVGAEVNN